MRRAEEPRRGPIALAWAHAWMWTCGWLWLATCTGALVVALGGRDVQQAVRGLLGLALAARGNPVPSAARAATIADHNISTSAWPLLLGPLGARGRGWSRALSDIVLAAWLLVNAVPVGAAVGAYGARILPYLPQLPLEWSGVAVGASAWLVERRRVLSVWERMAGTGTMAAALVCAAVLETWAVPHR